MNKASKPLLFALLFALVLQVGAFAAEPLPLTLGEGTQLSGALYDSRSYVPLRDFFDAMGGYSVDWDEASSLATISAEGFSLQVFEGKEYALLNGFPIYLQGGARILDGRLMLPARPLGALFSASVSWDEASGTSLACAPPLVPVAHSIQGYSEEDLYWLSRIIHAESEGEPFEGKLAVGHCVMNRVASEDFPNSIYAVIFDRRWGVQYEPTISGRIYEQPGQESVYAAMLILSAQTDSGDCLYFLNESIATNFWIPNNRSFYEEIGNHRFYL